MKNKKKGFSLIEVVMALAVISIGVLPILSMYPSALKMTVKATENEEWSRVTMSILDYVKSRGYKTLTSTTYSSLWSGDVSEKTYGPFIKNIGFGYMFIFINHFQGRKQWIIVVLPESHFICPVTEISMRFHKGII